MLFLKLRYPRNKGIDIFIVFIKIIKKRKDIDFDDIGAMIAYILEQLALRGVTGYSIPVISHTQELIDILVKTIEQLPDLTAKNKEKSA